MITSKTLLLAAVLAAVPLTISGASAQERHNNSTNTTMLPSDRGTIDRNQTDQRAMSDRSMHDRSMRDRSMRDHDMRDRDMRDRDMRDRDMQHHGWRRGHHYGWRHCMMRWNHHHRVRVCR